MDKDKKIKSEVNKLRRKYSHLSDEKKAIAWKLIDEIAFMGETILQLKETVNREGAVITSVNGNGFETMQEHPAQKSYNTTIKNYQSCIKQLVELLPDAKTDAADKAGEALKAFIAAGKK